jgi:hypothetical protein
MQTLAGGSLFKAYAHCYQIQDTALRPARMAVKNFVCCVHITRGFRVLVVPEIMQTLAGDSLFKAYAHSVLPSIHPMTGLSERNLLDLFP